MADSITDGKNPFQISPTYAWAKNKQKSKIFTLKVSPLSVPAPPMISNHPRGRTSSNSITGDCSVPYITLQEFGGDKQDDEVVDIEDLPTIPEQESSFIEGAQPQVVVPQTSNDENQTLTQNVETKDRENLLSADVEEGQKRKSSLPTPRSSSFRPDSPRSPIRRSLRKSFLGGSSVSLSHHN